MDETPPPTTERRNELGLKASADQYRTVRGERYLNWTSGWAPEGLVEAYRAAGVRCRRFGGPGEVYVHWKDTERAAEVDEAFRAAEAAHRS